MFEASRRSFQISGPQNRLFSDSDWKFGPLEERSTFEERCATRVHKSGHRNCILTRDVDFVDRFDRFDAVLFHVFDMALLGTIPGHFDFSGLRTPKQR